MYLILVNLWSESPINEKSTLWLLTIYDTQWLIGLQPVRFMGIPYFNSFLPSPLNTKITTTKSKNWSKNILMDVTPNLFSLKQQNIWHTLIIFYYWTFSGKPHNVQFHITKLTYCKRVLNKQYPQKWQWLRLAIINPWNDNFTANGKYASMLLGGTSVGRKNIKETGSITQIL